MGRAWAKVNCGIESQEASKNDGQTEENNIENIHMSHASMATVCRATIRVVLTIARLPLMVTFGTHGY